MIYERMFFEFLTKSISFIKAFTIDEFHYFCTFKN